MQGQGLTHHILLDLTHHLLLDLTQGHQLEGKAGLQLRLQTQVYQLVPPMLAIQLCILHQYRLDQCTELPCQVTQPHRFMRLAQF